MKTVKLLLLSLCIFMLCGCAESVSIDDRAYVMSVAIDKGEEKKYNITFQLPFITNEGGATDSARFYSISCQAESISDAVNATNASSAFYMSFAHTNFIVISEELAQEGNMTDVTFALSRVPEIKRTAMMLVARGSAKEMIEGLETETQSNLDRLQKNLIYETELSALMPNCTMRSALESLLSGEFDVMMALSSVNKKAQEGADKNEGESNASQKGDAQEAISQNNDGEEQQEQEENEDRGYSSQDIAGELLRAGGLGSDLSGAAVFAAGTYVGTLTGQEVRYAMMANGTFDTAMMIIPNPLGKANVTFLVKALRSPSIQVDLSGSVPRITGEVFLQAELNNYATEMDYQNQENLDIVAQAFRQELQKDMDEVVDKIQDMGSDVFGFGKHAIRQFIHAEDWQAYDWRTKYKEADIQITVNVTVKYFHLVSR